MIETVRAKPVRPHWMERFKEAEKECAELELKVYEINRDSARESAMLNEKCKFARDEIVFLRGTITELTATLKRAVKAQD